MLGPIRSKRISQQRKTTDSIQTRHACLLPYPDCDCLVLTAVTSASELEYPEGENFLPGGITQSVFDVIHSYYV